jgi:hypothetical protein
MRFQLFAIAVLLASTPSPLQADDAAELFSDDFATLDQAWGLANANRWVENNKLFLQPGIDAGTTDLYQGNVFGDSDIRVKLVQARGDATKLAGIAFWGLDYESYYLAGACPDGSCSIYRRVNGRWLNPFPPQKCAAIKQGADKSIELRVVTQGNLATFYVNGQQLTALHGSPPNGGSMIGLHGESGAVPSTWQFSEFKVLKPPPGAPARSDSTDGNTLFADDFATLSPAWGAGSDQMRVDGNKLILQPKHNDYCALYQGDLFGDADIRVKISQTVGGTKAGAAIAFWGGDNSWYYVAWIQPTGMFGISRQMYHRWLVPLPAQKSDAIKQGNGKSNELRVVTQGNLATLYINGQQAAKIKGFPPQGGGLVGLYAETGTPASTWQFSDFKVLKAPAGAVAANQDADDLIFADDFATLDPCWTWGFSKDEIRVDNHKLVVTAPIGKFYHPFYQGSIFEDFDLRVRLEEAQKNPDSFAGAIFWSSNVTDYYLAAVKPDGTFSVLRFANGRFLTPIPWQASDAIRKGIGQSNDLRVIAQGRSATLFINGKQVAAFTGFPPGGGSSIGFYVQASLKQPATWNFADFSLHKIQ